MTPNNILKLPKISIRIYIFLNFLNSYFTDLYFQSTMISIIINQSIKHPDFLRISSQYFFWKIRNWRKRMKVELVMQFLSSILRIGTLTKVLEFNYNRLVLYPKPCISPSTNWIPHIKFLGVVWVYHLHDIVTLFFYIFVYTVE